MASGQLPLPKGKKFSMVMMLLGQQDGEHESYSLKVVMMLFAQINIKVRKTTAWRRFGLPTWLEAIAARIKKCCTILFSKNKLVNWTFFGHNAQTPKRYLDRKVPALSTREAFFSHVGRAPKIKKDGAHHSFKTHLLTQIPLWSLSIMKRKYFSWLIHNWGSVLENRKVINPDLSWF